MSKALRSAIRKKSLEILDVAKTRLLSIGQKYYYCFKHFNIFSLDYNKFN